MMLMYPTWLRDIFVNHNFALQYLSELECRPKYTCLFLFFSFFEQRSKICTKLTRNVGLWPCFGYHILTVLESVSFSSFRTIWEKFCPGIIFVYHYSLIWLWLQKRLAHTHCSKEYIYSEMRAMYRDHEFQFNWGSAFFITFLMTCSQENKRIGFEFDIFFVKLQALRIASLKWHFVSVNFISQVTSWVGLQEEGPQTAYRVSITWASHIGASTLMGR